jgi:hypothetical protein
MNRGGQIIGKCVAFVTTRGKNRKGKGRQTNNSKTFTEYPKNVYTF